MVPPIFINLRLFFWKINNFPTTSLVFIHLEYRDVRHIEGKSILFEINDRYITPLI